MTTGGWNLRKAKDDYPAGMVYPAALDVTFVFAKNIVDRDMSTLIPKKYCRYR
jgi:hypothetical protein